jgi:hypothetical protein
VTSRRAWAALLAALALVAAGCGGTSKDDYEKKVDAVGKTLDDQFTEIGRDIQSAGSLPKAAGDVEKGADALDEAAADLDDIDPPDDAKDAHEKIVGGVELLADDFRAASKAAASNDTAKVLELLGGLETSKGFKQITQARNELKDAGYDVEG